ncbi:DR2241 family protein [Haloplanus sp.]|uniref:DR2241 family protein n=1 Tax=Haloplanus sp. TaxID=1961696 RepID=UPI002623BD4B|nr:DR2241 family protein [Haloplanus sp.]
MSGTTATDPDPDPDPAEALRTAAADGVDFDGLEATRHDDGFHLAVPDASYDDLSASAFLDATRGHEAYVENWFFWHQHAPQDDASWAFLRWIERPDDPVPERCERLADGTTREWGQLLVEARTDEGGQRRYDLRHVDDADADVATLSVHTDPTDARRIRKTDGNGRYRPLSTAPTLARGWIFDDLDPTALVRAVEGFYPATIQNWHRERAGDLDVAHWHETISRQTGIYGVVQTWDRGEGHDHVNWVAEACCADSQCLKRREWEYDEETPLNVPGGDGVFPCREPCSLVIATARRWTRMEAEQARTYEFDLTPSEKAQIEAIIDAVADGRTDEIREADTSDGANRYRARYLRAKRFDDAGNLCGVPTENDEAE